LGTASAALTLASLSFSGGYGLDVVLRNDGVHVSERAAQGAGAPVDHVSPARLADATWTRLELSVARGSSKVTMTLGGSAGPTSFSSAAGPIGAPTVRVGIVRTTGTTDQRTAHFDDIVVDLR
jgi:hypothetical protein